MGSSRHKKLESVIGYCLPLKFLRDVTNNFSDERLLGEGGFGKVYKGVPRRGHMIAVKKLTPTMPGIPNVQFENEAYHLTRLKHPNIVKLLGYCFHTETVPVWYDGRHVYAEKSEKLLCLEYLPKGSLRGHLSDESTGLDWDTRYKIIEGICYGLHYLHEEWDVTPIIHMDLKPANILLDNNMVPKIADFGLSRLFGEEQTRVSTKSCKGTLGYMAPEYLNKGIITKKLDIFSLGVIIIEIMTGHKDYPDEDEISSLEFVELVRKNWRRRLEKAPGYAFQEIDCQQIRRCIEIALVCVNFERANRPTSGQIIKMLHGEVICPLRKAKDDKPAKETVAAAANNEASYSVVVKKKSKEDKESVAASAMKASKIYEDDEKKKSKNDKPDKDTLDVAANEATHNHEGKAKEHRPYKDTVVATANKHAGNNRENEAKNKSKNEKPNKDAGQTTEPVATVVDRSLSALQQGAHNQVPSSHWPQGGKSVPFYVPQLQQPGHWWQQPLSPMDDHYFSHYEPNGRQVWLPLPPRENMYRLFDDENTNSCSIM